MVKVRRAKMEDVPTIISLIQQFPEGEILIDWDKATDACRDIIGDKSKGSIFVAEEDGTLLGVVTQSYPYATRCGGCYSCIEEIIVHGNARGKGVGGKILEAAIKEATARGCYELQVNRPSELGYPMYIKHGFLDLGKHLNLRLPR